MKKFKVGDKVVILDIDLSDTVREAMLGRETEIVSEHYLINHWVVRNTNPASPYECFFVREDSLSHVEEKTTNYLGKIDVLDHGDTTAT